MKNKNIVDFEDRINQLRDKLHQLIEHERLDSCIVQQLSQELDAVINLYYVHPDRPDSTLY